MPSKMLYLLGFVFRGNGERSVEYYWTAGAVQLLNVFLGQKGLFFGNEKSLIEIRLILYAFSSLCQGQMGSVTKRGTKRVLRRQGGSPKTAGNCTRLSLQA